MTRAGLARGPEKRTGTAFHRTYRTWLEKQITWVRKCRRQDGHLATIRLAIRTFFKIKFEGTSNTVESLCE